MSNRIQLKLNLTDEKLLQEIAEKNGFKDYHTWLHREVNGLPLKITQEIKCSTKGKRKTKQIPILPEHEEFYNKLSCSHSTTITSIINKFIVYPAIRNHLMDK